MSNLHAVTQKGIQAKALLESETLTEAFEETRKSFHREWVACGDPSRREALWAMTNALDAVQNELRRAVNRGEHAQEALKLQSDQ